MKVLNKIFGEEDIQGPVECDSQLFLCSGKFEQVDCAPEPPSHEPGEVDVEDTSNTGAPADGCQQTEGVEPERDQIFAASICDNIVG